MSRAEEKKDSTINSSALDVALRPKLWKHYIGQEQIKKTLSILMGAAKGRGEPIEHILLYGPAGLGKTTLAHLISHEMGTQIKVTSGPVIERVGDLAALLTNMSSGDILFIDEIHRMNKLVEEVLYSAMESRVLDIIIGKGPSARIIQLDLPPFTLLAATTRISLLSSPLRSRFSGGIYRLDFYKDSEIKEIIKRSSAALGTNITEDAINEIAMRSRCTPRASNHLLKRCRDVAEVDGENQISYKVALKTLKLLGIDSMGLGGEDIKLIETLVLKFSGNPVGLNTLSASMSEDANTIEEVYEPYLIRLGFIERTPRGRMATERAFKHIGKSMGSNKQDKLI